MKSLIPFSWLRPYHLMLAWLAALVYRFPSQKLIVIGVTGTTGKTTTAYFIAKALEASGYLTGCTTTAMIKIGQKEWINSTKMTMPGRFFLQRMLRRMVQAGCRYAVVETTSQGILQYRHIGIAYDLVVFTNLSPEHIEAHGGFENYKRTKQELFLRLGKLRKKILEGKLVSRAAVINADSPYGAFFAQTKGIPSVFWYSLDLHHGFFPGKIEIGPESTAILVQGQEIVLRVPGKFNAANAIAALAVCQVLGVNVVQAAVQLSQIQRIPGRFESVDVGQPWRVIIDYAHEPESMKHLYDALSHMPHRKILHVLGSCGGGRDVSRRTVLGNLAGKYADVVIVTNEDPYDDNPQTIIDQVTEGAIMAGKKLGSTLLKIIDRQQAIERAMQLAEKDDIVLLTGKGCEPWICAAHGEKIAWDERQEAEQAIMKRNAGHVWSAAS